MESECAFKIAGITSGEENRTAFTLFFAAQINDTGLPYHCREIMPLKKKGGCHAAIRLVVLPIVFIPGRPRRTIPAVRLNIADFLSAKNRFPFP